MMLCRRMRFVSVREALCRLLLYASLAVGCSLILIQLMTSSPQEPPDISFRFDKIQENSSLPNTAAVNLILDEVSWLEDLSNREPVCIENDTFILAVVPSAVHHFKERQRIRETWANPKLYSITRIRTVFVLGATTNTSLQTAVQSEMDAHNDIIQNEFIDSYRNLTYKTISWLSWARDWCTETPFVAKIDDDMVVNPFHLAQYLRDRILVDPSVQHIYGRLMKKSSPMRAGKWAVTKKEYPKDKYPPFVLGPAYILGRNCLNRLLTYTYYTPCLWLEDVYVTGLVARAAGIKHVQIDKLLYTKKLNRKLYSGKVAFYIGASEKLKNHAWRGILKYAPKVTIVAKSS